MTDFRMMMSEVGGPEVIRREDVAVPAPGPGCARVRQRAIGLNYIDTYRRSGLYPVELPAGLGTEAAGVVEAVGAEVAGFAPGDRVSYATGPIDAYATVRVIDAEHLLPLPDGLDDETAAAGTLKGMTACFLIEDCAEVRQGQTVLVLAAAGGVGSVLVQWLAQVGAVVIAHTGSPEKAERAGALGAAHALSCGWDRLPAAVRDITGGRGVDCVFDGIGADSWQASLSSVARRGLLVTYGNASGPVPPFDALALMRAGSIFVTRPTLGDYAATAPKRRALAARLYKRIARQDLVIPIGQRLALEEAAEAHRRLEARSTHGSTVLTVSGD